MTRSLVESSIGTVSSEKKEEVTRVRATPTNRRRDENGKIWRRKNTTIRGEWPNGPFNFPG